MLALDKNKIKGDKKKKKQDLITNEIFFPMQNKYRNQLLPQTPLIYLIFLFFGGMGVSDHLYEKIKSV